MARTASAEIYQDLKSEIENGLYAYEDLIPSQSMLVKRYHCAHNTVRKAISRLTGEGYCLPIHGKGVRVIWKPREDADSFALGGIETFAMSAERNGMTPRTEVKLFELIETNDELSKLTGFASATMLLHVERVRYLDDRPLIRDKSYYLATAVEGITQQQAEHSVYEYIESVRGLRIATSKRTISMEVATETDRQWLDVSDCNYLAKVTHSTYDSNAQLFEYAESRYHPAHFLFHDTVIRGK